MKTIESTSLLAAPPQAVWDVLVDFARYPDWNPFIVALSGELRQGAKLRATFRLPGRKDRTFTPSLTTVEPNGHLAWLGRLTVPRLFDAHHEFLLAPHEGGTRLVHRETFRGVLVPLLGGTLRATHRAFMAMDTALAQRLAAG